MGGGYNNLAGRDRAHTVTPPVILQSSTFAPYAWVTPVNVQPQRQVALEAGKSNVDIADELVISPNTVVRHVSNILTKTGSSNRTEAARYASQHELTQ